MATKMKAIRPKISKAPKAPRAPKLVCVIWRDKTNRRNELSTLSYPDGTTRVYRPTMLDPRCRHPKTGQPVEFVPTLGKAWDILERGDFTPIAVPLHVVEDLLRRPRFASKPWPLYRPA